MLLFIQHEVNHVFKPLRNIEGKGKKLNKWRDTMKTRTLTMAVLAVAVVSVASFGQGSTYWYNYTDPSWPYRYSEPDQAYPIVAPYYYHPGYDTVAMVLLGANDNYILTDWGKGVKIGTTGYGKLAATAEPIWIHASNAVSPGSVTFPYQVGIGTTNPGSRLTIEGSLALKSVVSNGNYDAAFDDIVILVNSSSSSTVTLPAAVWPDRIGRTYYIKRVGTGSVLVQPGPLDYIDNLARGAAKTLTAQNQCIQIVLGSLNHWYIISNNN
jgi:hypothetical protein